MRVWFGCVHRFLFRIHVTNDIFKELNRQNPLQVLLLLFPSFTLALSPSLFLFCSLPIYLSHFNILPFNHSENVVNHLEATQNNIPRTVERWRMNAHFLMYILVGKEDVDNDDRQQQFQTH